MKKVLRRVVLIGLALLVLIQFVPYGRSHENPPGRTEPTWDSARTRELVARACFDCHSNETHWPWYTSIAPISWLVQRDVDEGREHLNFSEFDQPQRNAEDAADEVEDGEMPPRMYRLGHPEARLSDAEKTELIRGLRATFGDGGRGRGRGRGRSDD